jgi:hypothetical protein
MNGARKMKGARRRRVRGRGFFDSVWSGIKSVARPAWDIARDNKLISSGIKLLPVPYSGVAGNLASKLGVGRRRRRRVGAKRVYALAVRPKVGARRRKRPSRYGGRKRRVARHTIGRVVRLM